MKYHLMNFSSVIGCRSCLLSRTLIVIQADMNAFKLNRPSFYGGKSWSRVPVNNVPLGFNLRRRIEFLMRLFHYGTIFDFFLFLQKHWHPMT